MQWSYLLRCRKNHFEFTEPLFRSAFLCLRTEWLTLYRASLLQSYLIAFIIFWIRLIRQYDTSLPQYATIPIELFERNNMDFLNSYHTRMCAYQFAQGELIPRNGSVWTATSSNGISSCAPSFLRRRRTSVFSSGVATESSFKVTSGTEPTKGHLSVSVIAFLSTKWSEEDGRLRRNSQRYVKGGDHHGLEVQRGGRKSIRRDFF